LDGFLKNGSFFPSIVRSRSLQFRKGVAFRHFARRWAQWANVVRGLAVAAIDWTGERRLRRGQGEQAAKRKATRGEWPHAAGHDGHDASLGGHCRLFQTPFSWISVAKSLGRPMLADKAYFAYVNYR
jgi:hypothetical protein